MGRSRPSGLLQAPWLLLGNVVYSLYQWALVALVAKTWGTTTVGQFAFGLAVCGPVFLFSNLNLRTVIATDVKRDFCLATFFRLRSTLSAVALISVLLLAAIFGDPREDSFRILAVVALLKAVETFSDLMYGALQQIGELKIVGISMVMRSIASILVAGVALRAHVPLWSVLLMVLAIWCLAFLLFDYPVTWRCWNKSVGREPNSELGPARRARIGSLTRMSVPLGVVAALVSLDANLPRYIVQGYQGNAELGIYAGIGFIILAGNNVVISVCQAVVSRLAALHHHGMADRFQRTVFVLIASVLAACVLGGAVATCCGDHILGFVYSSEYLGRQSLFATLVFGAFFGYAALILQYATTAVRQYSVQIWVYGASILLTATSCLLMGRYWGTQGVAVGRVLGWAAQFVLLLTIMLRSKPESRSVPASPNGR